MIDGTQIFTALPSTDQEQLIAKLTEKVFANGAKIIEQARHPHRVAPHAPPRAEGAQRPGPGNLESSDAGGVGRPADVPPPGHALEAD